jgi:hypothetical protein
MSRTRLATNRHDFISIDSDITGERSRAGAIHDPAIADY